MSGGRTATDRVPVPVDQLAAADPAPDLPPVPAAGVLCWREGRDGVPEVLLVHRPRYDDWSWPKGKLQPGEPLPECAVREAAEETGLRVVLGRPLPAVTYVLPDGRTKVVRYWAAREVGPAPAAGGAGRHEVDRTRWVAAHEAAELLTQAGDAAPLDALTAMARGRVLATSPVVVVRHGTARPRDAWSRADSDRPLVAAGRRQALALASLLQCWRPERVLSSPWLRCRETVRPYLALGGARLSTKKGLSEDGFRRDPEKVGKHVRRLLERARPALLCTHRPVLPAVFAALEGVATADSSTRLPRAEPYLAPGEALVAHVTHGPRPRVVDVERHAAAR